MPALYVLAILAAIGPPFYFAMTSASDWRDDFLNRRALIVGLLALGLAAVTDSRPNEASGNWGGYWWNAAANLPAIGHTSLLFALLASLGAWLAFAAGHRLWREAGPAASLPLLLAALAWLGTTLTNRLIFHRYYEPMLLVFLLCWVALLTTARDNKAPRRRWPLVVLARLQLIITVVTAHGQAHGLFRP